MSGLEDPHRADLGGPDLPEASDPSPEAPALIDWGRTGRRLRGVVLVLAVVVIVGWVALSLTGDAGFRLRVLGEMTGLALLVAIAAEVVIVGSVALAGMLRAGERGERLARSDVSLLPPQVRRDRQARRDRQS